ncbi:MAG TPA: division/cell wall cluster transcriptional repressor MraZ [Myxococcales bacterium]|jgi:MraZ protein|nr:division/cell wall cluster transcriptional repressor MraZ [Myxococcales bacterium]HIL02640.1 division/cell wall cluster transcriptional repressor MraZ [Myxococcales bacterium]
MFRGRFLHTMDTKGRVSIPSGFRVEIQRRSQNDPILASQGSHLALFPADEWEKKEETLLGLSEFDTDAQDLQRIMVGEASDSPLDAQGRILVPTLMRKEAELASKVLVIGVLNRIELWNPERYEEKKRMTSLRYEEINRNVDPNRQQPGD